MLEAPPRRTAGQHDRTDECALVGAVREEAVVAGRDGEAVGVEQDGNHTQAAALNPCVNPYHGTTVTATANVTENIRTRDQISGARWFWAVSFMLGIPEVIGFVIVADGGRPAYPEAGDASLFGGKQRIEGLPGRGCRRIGCL